MPNPAPFSVQPLDAIAFLKRKVNIPTTRWNDLWQDMHAAGFMVAGAQKSALIEDFHEAVTAALENGTTLEAFRQDFDKIVARHGWDYNGSRNWRSKIIYQTNMRAARSAGRWASIQRGKKRRPYILYTTAGDNRVRPQHKKWHNLVLPVDDPFWDTHYPPNGWSCRCQANSLSERNLKKRGLKVSPAPKIEYEDRLIKTQSGEMTVRVPEGIHTGFAYNVGTAGFGRGPNTAALERFGWFEGMNVPGALTAKQYQQLDLADTDYRMMPAARDKEHAQDILREVLGGNEKVFVDPTGSRIRVTQSLVDHLWNNVDGQVRLTRERFFGLIPDLIEKPAEIWVGFARSNITGRMVLRRRYIRYVQLDKNRTLIMVANELHGEWVSLTFFHGPKGSIKNARMGLRVFESGN